MNTYKIVGFENSIILFSVSDGEKEQIIKINSKEYKNYCPPVSWPKFTSTHYTIIESDCNERQLGFNKGDVVLLENSKIGIKHLITNDKFTENINNLTLKYRKTTQMELDKYEYLHHNDGYSDNAKIYLYLSNLKLK